MGGTNEILNSTHFAQIFGDSSQDFMFLRQSLCLAWDDQFHTVGGCLASETSPGHCLILFGDLNKGSWVYLIWSSVSFRDYRNPKSLLRALLSTATWCYKLTAPTSLPFGATRLTRDKRWESTQEHLKEGETKSHSSDLRTKLRLTDTGGQFGDTHPTCGKTGNQVQVFGLLFQFVFPIFPVTSQWRNVHCWSQADVMSQGGKGVRQGKWREESKMTGILSVRYASLYKTLQTFYWRALIISIGFPGGASGKESPSL